MLDWPAASVLLGTLATAAVAIWKWEPRRSDPANGRYASATSLADIGARMSALEKAHYTFRDEIRSDLKDLQKEIRARD